jgi:hypothetical protein
MLKIGFYYHNLFQLIILRISGSLSDSSGNKANSASKLNLAWFRLNLAIVLKRN